jgi:F0F1-type ATP synthase alpha subunit
MLAETTAELVAEQSRLQLELQCQSPEASAALEEAVVSWTTRCEQLQEQLSVSAAVAATSDSRMKKAESIVNDAISSHAATRENLVRLEESNAQLSRQLTDAEHRLQHQGEQVGELQAEHQRQLASVEEDRTQTELEWNKALDEAEAREAIALANAATAEEECEEHKAQLLQQLKETRATAEALEKRLREFVDVAAAAAAAAEAEH